MILLKYLNKNCRNRVVANSAPSQIACRFLGNKNNPCALDCICKDCEEKGIAYFYTVILSAILTIYILLFWLGRLTRLSEPISWLFGFLAKPIKSLIYLLASTVKFFKELPF